MFTMALSLCILLAVLVSGSIFALCFFHRRPEEILPLTVMSIVAVLYAAGLLGILAVGFYLVLACAALLLVLSLFRVLREGRFRGFLVEFFTPGLCIFCGLLVFQLYLDYGMLAHEWDEFSHWMDCVKAMCILDDFVSNPASYSTYASYPPAMSLFQYFVQRIYLSLHPGAPFCEWLVYLAYQIFALAVLCPFLRGFSRIRPLENFALAAAVFLAPTIIFRNFYTSIYIDAFVGILAGCGFAMVMLHGKKDGVYYLYLSLLCFCLVLAKDAGLLFAVFVVFAFLLDWLMDPYRTGEKIGPAGLFAGFSPVLALLLAKLSWSLELARHGVEKVFDQPMDFFAYTRMFFLHNDTTFWQSVVDKFQSRFSVVSLGFGLKFIEASYLGLSIAFGLLLILVFLVYRHHEPGRRWSRLAVMAVLALCTAGYVYGLGATYVYRFSTREASQLLSYERYMGMAYEALWIFLVLAALVYVQETMRERKGSNAAMALVLLVSLLLAPVLNISNYITKNCVRDASELRLEFEAFGEKIHAVCDGDDKIYFIHQEDNGRYYYIMKFLFRPNIVTGAYSIGKPFYEGDEWTKEMTAGEFRQILLEEEYDYVVVDHMNPYFVEEFGCLFADPGEMEDKTIYRLNRESELLEKCRTP